VLGEWGRGVPEGNSARWLGLGNRLSRCILPNGEYANKRHTGSEVVPWTLGVLSALLAMPPLVVLARTGISEPVFGGLVFGLVLPAS
jgi:hypothetical protein